MDRSISVATGSSQNFRLATLGNYTWYPGSELLSAHIILVEILMLAASLGDCPFLPFVIQSFSAFPFTARPDFLSCLATAKSEPHSYSSTVQ